MMRASRKSICSQPHCRQHLSHHLHDCSSFHAADTAPHSTAKPTGRYSSALRHSKWPDSLSHHVRMMYGNYPHRQYVIFTVKWPTLTKKYLAYATDRLCRNTLCTTYIFRPYGHLFHARHRCSQRDTVGTYLRFGSSFHMERSSLHNLDLCPVLT